MLRLTGHLSKEGKYWAIECPDLQAYTQGTSKQNALAMMVDWVRSMLEMPDLNISITAQGDTFAMFFEDPRPILGLLFAQTRAAAGLTLQQIVDRLGKGRPPNVSQYETGKHDPSFTKAQELVGAMGYDLQISLVKKADNQPKSESLDKPRKSIRASKTSKKSSRRAS